MSSRHRPATAENPTRLSRESPWALHVLMFGSGALALVYEILWMRRLAALFGATTPAIAATLAAVFLGFTAGSLSIGARAARALRPLRAYGWLEIGAGLGALMVEPLLLLYQHLYPQLYQGLAGSSVGFSCVKTLLAMGALFLPTFCMGGTVPLLSEAIKSERRRLGISAGGLYAANTFGAALGALSVPFVWLPHLSARASYGVCIVGSWLIGAVAWWLDIRQRKPTATATVGKTFQDGPPLPSPLLPKREEREKKRAALRLAGGARAGTSPGSPSLRVLTVLAAISGALFFILQVNWARMFAQVHENSIYSFSLVLAVLLAGLAGGAALARQLLRAGHPPARFLGAAWITSGVVVFATPHLFYALTGGLSYVRASGGWTSYGLRLLWLTLPTVLLPALLAGMVLPLLMELAGEDSKQPSGRLLGGLLGANTIGAIAGSLTAAFLLPAWLGLWGSLVLVACAMIVSGDFCLGGGAAHRSLPVRRLILYTALAAGLFLWNPAKVSRTKLRADQGETLLSLAEGSHGIVAVVEQPASRRIKLNNYYVLGGTASTGDERIQGHLPLLLHPAPKTAAFLGMGTGITAGAARLHPVDQITIVELVPEVIAAARTYFAEANLQVIDSPRTEVIDGDARNFLLGSGRRFDVIVGDLVVPWRSGEASLYTSEHFAAARRALTPGGIFCQWLPMFQLSEAEFNMVAASFLDIFPATTLWRGDFAPNQSAIALVGHLDEIDRTMVERRLRELKADETNPSLAHAAGFWMFLAGPLDPREERFARARRNRENEPWLEILGPLDHAGSSHGDASLFVGRPLEAFLNDLQGRPLAGTPLAKLGSAQLEWRKVGANLGAISILVSEGHAREADELLRQTTAMLPAEIRGFFDGSAPPQPGGR